jgi:hypothetical protein
VVQIDHLSSKQIKQFHSELGRAIGCVFVNSGPLAWLAKRTLDKIGMSYFNFVPEKLLFSRPMCTGRIILLPYAVGCDEIPAARQIYTAVHEACHCQRVKDFPGNVFDWMANYFNPKNRKFCALEEGAAWQSVAAVSWAVEGRIKRLKLESYWLDAGAFSLAERSYKAYYKQLQMSGRGSSHDPVSKAAIKILLRMGVEPK